MAIDPKGVSSLAAGTLIMLIIGSMYTFGTFTPYIASYLYHHGNHGIQTVTISLIFPFLLVTMNIGIITGSQLGQRIDIRLVTMGAMVLYAATLFTLSYMNTLVGYMIFYGAFNGLSIGLPYVLPLGNAYKYFPNRKGLCSGICIMGLGFGSLVFNQIILKIMNPNNLKPVNHIFPPEVANNLPLTLKVLAGVYLGLGAIGCCMTFPKKIEQTRQTLMSDNSMVTSQDTEITEIKQCQNLKDALTHPKFYLLAILIGFMTAFGMFIAFNYKQYGLAYITDDKFLTLVGSLGGISNGSSRFVWGYALDHFSFKKIVLIINIGLFCIAVTFSFIVSIKPAFLIYIVVCYFLYGGLFAIFPAKTFNMFGQKQGSRIYGYVFSGFTLAALIQFLLHYFLVSAFGKEGFRYGFYGLAGLQIIGLIMCLTIDFNINWTEYYQKKSIKS